MRQTIALSLLAVALILTRGALVAKLLDDGAWGGALSIFLGAALSFYVLLGLLVLGRRLFGGSGASFAESRLNYVCLVGALAITLAAPPPM